MALLRSVATVGSYTMLSRLTGFARDVLMAALLGAGPVSDAFFVAFKLPNFFRRLFAEGAFNAAFVPLFSSQLHHGGATNAKRFAEEVISVLLVVLFVFVTALQIAMPWVMLIFAPGWYDEKAKFDLAVELTRIAFPYLLFISLVSFYGAVLNSLSRFAAAAATPILLNLVMIGALLWLTPHVETPGHALAWGVTLAGLVELVWLAIALDRAGMSLRFRAPRLTAGVKRLLKLILPGALGAGVVQVNLLIDIVIASLLPTGSITFLYYADRINELPVGVVGVAVGTALLPLLSRQIRQGDERAAKDSLNRAIEIALLLALPAAAASMAIAEPIIATLFQRGAFGEAETAKTALALIAFSVGLPAYVLVKVLAPAFFAREDTRTPVRIAIGCVILNFLLNVTLGLGTPLAHVGIALSTAIAAWVNSALLATLAARRGYLEADARLKSKIPRMVLASAIMAAALLGAERFLTAPLHGNEAERGFALAVLVAIGLAVFALCALALKAAAWGDVKSRLPLTRRRVRT
jgi:putative peptidoglycan lipid II flippase